MKQFWMDWKGKTMSDVEFFFSYWYVFTLVIATVIVGAYFLTWWDVYGAGRWKKTNVEPVATTEAEGSRGCRGERGTQQGG